MVFTRIYSCRQNCSDDTTHLLTYSCWLHKPTLPKCFAPEDPRMDSTCGLRKDSSSTYTLKFRHVRTFENLFRNTGASACCSDSEGLIQKRCTLGAHQTELVVEREKISAMAVELLSMRTARFPCQVTT